jgi:hypothetical protein
MAIGSEKPLLTTVPRRGRVSEEADFIRTYVEYADIIEAPAEAHEAVATSLLATVLNKHVFIQHGALAIPLDMWQLLLSPSGFGRNTLVDLARPLLDNAALGDVILNVTWGSKQAFYQNIAENGTGLFVWPELALVLKTLSDPRFGGVKEWITDRYDNLSIPSKIGYRETGKASDTPPITFQQAPRIGILATSSHDWFTSNLVSEDTTGGFVPRWVLVNLPATHKLVPKPQKPDESLIKPLQEHLLRARELQGGADLSDVEELYSDWYRRTSQMFEAQPNVGLAKPFFHRLRTHVLKLAVIYEVSQSRTLKVSRSAMQRAIGTAKTTMESIFALLPTGMNHEGAEVTKIAERVQSAGVEGLPKSVLTKAFQATRQQDREARLRTLMDTGEIVRFRRTSSGRPGTLLVHESYVKEHEASFPEDEQF